MQFIKGTLELNKNDYESILSQINKGNTVLEALEKELHKNKILLNDVSEIKITLGMNKKYLRLYSEIICNLWEKKLWQVRK